MTTFTHEQIELLLDENCCHECEGVGKDKVCVRIEAIAELPDGAPARFTWRRLSRRVIRADGPERLSPEWWRPPEDRRAIRTRDYYRVEDEAGGRYWLFREGLYGREYGGGEGERAPSWWMHGVLP